jgi:uncharacterized RDD family membrane protein YckC
VITSEPRALVSVWPRLKAQVVDTLILALATAAVTLIIEGGFLADVQLRTFWVTGVILAFAYFTLFEWRGGATLGKRVVDIEVRSEAGGRPSLGQAFVRTVFRVIDGLGFYLIGAVAVWSSTERQRLGDRVAGTIVVRARPDAPSLRHDGTHRLDQDDAEPFNVAVQSEIGRPPPR